MAAILNSAILNLAILDSATLVFPLKLTHTCQDWFPPFAQKKPSLIHSDSTWWWQPSWILPCWIKKTSLIHSDSTWWWQSSWTCHVGFRHLSFLLSDSLKNTLTPLDSDSNYSIWLKLTFSLNLPSWIPPSWKTSLTLPSPPFAQKKLHSFILTQLDDGSPILNSTMLDSDTLISSLRFTQNTLTPLWLWLKLIQSDSNSFILTQLDDGSHLEFWPSWIWPSWIFSILVWLTLAQDSLSPFAQKRLHSHFPPHHLHKKYLHSFILTQLADGSHLEFYCCWIKKTSLIHSDSIWWWLPSGILPCWIQTPCFLLSDSLKNTLTPLWLWLKLIQSDSNSFILTKLDDGNHLEFGHHGFSHLSFSSQTHSHLPRLVPTICTKKTFTHSFWLNLLMAATLNSTMLDSDTFLSSLRFTQKHSHSTLTLDSN